MARPVKPINENQLKTLCRIQCTLAEMAAVLEVDKSTLSRRYATDIENWRADGRTSLRRAQWKKALGGNPTMLIWLGKQELGQKDRSDWTSADLPIKAYINVNTDKV